VKKVGVDMRIKVVVLTIMVILLALSGISLQLNLAYEDDFHKMQAINNDFENLAVFHAEGLHAVDMLLDIKDEEIYGNALKREWLKEAEEDNLSRLKVALNASISILDQMLSNPMVHQKGLGKIDASKIFENELKAVRQEFLDYKFDIENTVGSTPWPYVAIKKPYLTLKNNVDDLKASYSIYYEVVCHHRMLIDNSFTIITLVLLFILAVMILRFMYKDLPYLVSRFRRLEDRSYKPSIKRFMPIFREEIDTHGEIEKILDEEARTKAFKERVVGTYVLDEIVDKLYEDVKAEFGVDRVSIAFVNYSSASIISEYVVHEKPSIHLAPGFSVPIEKTSLKEILHSKEGIIRNHLSGITYSSSGAGHLLKKDDIKSNLTLPLKANDVVFGFMFFSSEKKGFFDRDHMRRLQKMTDEITGFLNRSYLTKIILSEFTASFAQLVDKKDNETGGHILRMVAYSVTIAKELSKMKIEGYDVDKRMILDIQRNAAAHDIGKVGVPDAILKKPGKLTDQEWEVMKKHSEIGADIFRNIRKDMNMFDEDFYGMAEDIARYHHERFDGKGYPEGLEGHEIPLVARIVTIGDVFDALTSERVYKKAFSFEKAVEIIKEGSGSQFDPYVVQAFEGALSDIYPIYVSENAFEPENNL
jgi:HD-GYP domain-containing protein (c-di-GMP phosphodiesterase class II)